MNLFFHAPAALFCPKMSQFSKVVTCFICIYKLLCLSILILVKTNPESTITTAMGSMISFSVTVYEPMQIVFNFQDKSASILITAANCNSTSPYMIIFNHTYELSGSYRISFSDYLPLSYWRIETAETGLLSTYTNLYSILTVNVGNGIQTTSENSSIITYFIFGNQFII